MATEDYRLSYRGFARNIGLLARPSDPRTDAGERLDDENLPRKSKVYFDISQCIGTAFSADHGSGRPRQCGKTAGARWMLPHDSRRYLDVEDPSPCRQDQRKPTARGGLTTRGRSAPGDDSVPLRDSPYGPGPHRPAHPQLCPEAQG